ncbi:hypothetical protein PG991_012034 [Apiospora marii]|uniref:Uncharacterized protein n=1 Tax=Apiospora marii TaxID=335849 RepID=A0ABR1RGZ7_9PEZI
MAESNGRYQRILASTSSYSWLTTETAATLHNAVTELYTQAWDDMQYGYVNLTQEIERPRLEPSRAINGVITQVQCTSIPRSRLSKNQTLEINNFGRNWAIPASIWNATGSGPSSTVNLTWIDMHNTSQKSIGVLVTLPQAFQNLSGVDIVNDTTLRQEAVICPCAVVARWAPVNTEWDANTTDIVPSNPTKAILPDLGYVWDYNELSKEYGASEPIRIGVEWANMLNLGGRLVKAGNGETVNVSSIEALLWRHMSQWPRAGDGLPIWTRVEWGAPSHVQGDNETWDGSSVERLAARILSLAVTDGISRVADWADYDVIYGGSEPPPGVYSITIDIYRYGWGYGLLSGVTIFAVCVLFTHAVMVLAYAGYSIFLAVRRKPVTYKMLTDVGELVVMSLGSQPAPRLREGKELPWNTTISVREKGGDRLELVSGVDMDHLPEADKPYWRVNSGDFWKLPGSLHRRFFKKA